MLGRVSIFLNYTDMRSRLFFNFSCVIQFFDFSQRLFHQILNKFLALSFVDFFHTVKKMLALRLDIFSVQAARKLRNLRMADSCRTTGRTAAAHDAIKRKIRAFCKITALRVGNVLHCLKILRAGACAGIASYARINFRVKLHHNSLFRLNLVDVVNLFNKREERKCRNVHSINNFLRAGKTSLKLVFAFHAVNCRASAAETVSATAASFQLVASVFHRIHYCKFCRYFIFFSKQIYCSHLSFIFCHFYTPKRGRLPLTSNLRFSAAPSPKGLMPLKNPGETEPQVSNISILEVILQAGQS